MEQSISKFNNKNFSEFKEELSQLLIEKIDPISKEIKRLTKDEKYLDDILIDGSRKADQVASEKVNKIKQILGF